MQIAEKKVAGKSRAGKTIAAAGERKPLTRNIIKNVGKWSTEQKIAVIKSGISKAEFEAVKKETTLDYEALSHILSVTKATLHNKKGNERYGAIVSERLLMFAEIYVRGVELFGTREKFIHWLNSPIRSTGGIPPLELMDTSYGMEEVTRIIGRIEHGVYS